LTCRIVQYKDRDRFDESKTDFQEQNLLGLTAHHRRAFYYSVGKLLWNTMSNCRKLARVRTPHRISFCQTMRSTVHVRSWFEPKPILCAPVPPTGVRFANLADWQISLADTLDEPAQAAASSGLATTMPVIRSCMDGLFWCGSGC
jgi:hypothetical protein